MAVRLRCAYNPLSHRPPVNKILVLEIHDTELETDADIEFNMRPNSEPLHGYDPESNDIFYPIRASTLGFNILIENQDHQDFLDDYVAAAEGRFLIRLYRQVTESTEETLFIGKLIHDITTLVMERNPVLSMSAVDPFLDLEHVEYDISTYPQTWISIILDYIILQSATVNYFYPNDEDEILHIYNEWQDVQHADTTDILSSTYMQNYFSRDEGGKNVISGLGSI